MKKLLARLQQAKSMKSAVSWRMPGRVLYAVSHCYPFSSNGYAVRTHGIASALAADGVNLVVASRPGVAFEAVAAGGLAPEAIRYSHDQDGVRYVHGAEPVRKMNASHDYVRASVAFWAELIAVFNPSLVMAASNWQVALPAAIAAREAGLPFAYDVRGFWEVSRVSREPEWQNSAAYALDVECESAVAAQADAVFTINRFMADELVRRGVQPKRITLVPNGFTPDASAPVACDYAVASRYVIGYVGSFNAYEGLEQLLHATAALRKQGLDVAVLLVGSGQMSGMDGGQEVCAVTQSLREAARSLDIEEFVHLPGRVPPDAVASWYALLDVVVIPRRPLPVCELVSPMKPLEAAALGKQVLLSDVAPMAEMAEHCPNNLQLFAKGDVSSLTEKLGQLLRAGNFNPPPCKALEGFTWGRNVEGMVAALRGLATSAGEADA